MNLPVLWEQQYLPTVPAIPLRENSPMLWAERALFLPCKFQSRQVRKRQYQGLFHQENISACKVRSPISAPQRLYPQRAGYMYSHCRQEKIRQGEKSPDKTRPHLRQKLRLILPPLPLHISTVSSARDSSKKLDLTWADGCFIPSMP